MGKKLFGVLAAIVVMMMAAPAQADGFADSRSDYFERVAGLEVMSQNLYIGADLDRVLQGESPAAILATIQQTNYPARAVEIAKGIDDFNPDLVGLQEAWSIALFDAHGNVLFSQDYLDILLRALKAQEEPYAVSSVSVNADVILPVDPVAGTFARVIDRDVIIHRPGSVSISNPFSTNFDDNFTVELGGVPLEFTRGYTAVDAKVGRQSYRFVNTHLEVENAPCETADGFRVCQELQAQQLVHDLAHETKPVILVGDFNAQPGEPTYQTVQKAGYVDTWRSTYEKGYTCCQAETLDNVESLLDKRIDHIFVRRQDVFLLYARTTVVGDWEERKTEDGLWYSDHGGPWARLLLGIR